MVNRLLGKSFLGLLAAGALAPLAQAADAPTLNTGSTAWMVTAAVLVLFMCLPGLALFYGGLVRAKNMLSLFTQCFGIAGLVGVLWVIYGYSMVVDSTGMIEGQVTFNSFVGGLSRAFLAGMTPESLVGDIPEGVFVTFQMTFAIITPALIAGAFAERMKFSAALWFMALWFTLVYAPVAHMVWGGAGALMHNWGVLDFAGGTAVHINAGVAALAACLILGKRKGYQNTPMPAHNLSLTMAGAAMLWVGWFGFNIGSGGGLNGTSGIVMLNTQLGPAPAFSAGCSPSGSRLENLALWASPVVPWPVWSALPCVCLCRRRRCVGHRFAVWGVLLLERHRAQASLWL